jgi:hypothetical protein
MTAGNAVMFSVNGAGGLAFDRLFGIELRSGRTTERIQQREV